MKKISIVGIMVLFALLVGCSNGKIDETNVTIAVLGDIPSGTFEHVTFKEVDLPTFIKKQDKYDALWVTKESFAPFFVAKHKTMFYQTPVPMYFVDMPTLLSGVTVPHAVFKDDYKYDTLLFSKESKVQAQAFFNQPNQTSSRMFSGYKTKKEVYEAIFHDIRLIKESK